jgi:hypothetical protein
VRSTDTDAEVKQADDGLAKSRLQININYIHYSLKTPLVLDFPIISDSDGHINPCRENIWKLLSARDGMICAGIVLLADGDVRTTGRLLWSW